MRLITDTNILLRCIRGRAMDTVELLLTEGIELVTTDHNVRECVQVLTRKMHLAYLDAMLQTEMALRPFAIIDSDEYAPLRALAQRRLHPRGQSDWPVLAAALSLEVGIWSDDRDFFGVGVAVWSTPIVRTMAEPR